MKFKVGDIVRATVDGETLEGVIKVIDSDSIPYLVYVDNVKGRHYWWFGDDDLELVKRGENNIKKSDLKNGAIVELRNNDKYILLLNCCNEGDRDDLFISLNDGGYLKFSYYDEDLRDCDSSNFDIMKVCQNYYVGDNIRSHILKQNENDWTWIRDEEKSKYFTGKVVCIDCKNDFLTKGKIYEFKDGLSIDDENDVFPCTKNGITDIDDLNDRFFSEFIEIKE